MRVCLFECALFCYLMFFIPGLAKVCKNRFSLASGTLLNTLANFNIGVLEGLNFFSDLQFLQSPFQDFGDSANYNCYQREFHVS